MSVDPPSFLVGAALDRLSLPVHLGLLFEVPIREVVYIGIEGLFGVTDGARSQLSVGLGARF